jgi:hypothetical protein
MPSDILHLEVTEHKASMIGNAWAISCIQDCCGNCGGFDCAVGTKGTTVDMHQTLEFDRPVWPRLWNEALSDQGAANTPKAAFSLQLISGGVMSREFAFTVERSDFDASGAVDGADLAYLLSRWGQNATENPGMFFGYYARMDLNDDGKLDGADLGILLLHWGEVP